MSLAHRTFALPLLAAALSTGCTTVTVVDNVDFALDWGILLGATDAMHSPYVAGAGITVYAESSDTHEKMQGWTMTSSAPSIFAIVTPHNDDTGLWAECTATAPGDAVITISDASGNVKHTHNVSVRQPDSAQVFSHGPLLINHPDSEALVTNPQIVNGGTATFLIEWFADGQRLGGNGVLSTEGPATVDAVAETTEFLVERDWLAVTPHALGAQSIALFADGKQVTTLPITVVDPTAVDHIQIEGQDETGAANGTWLVALAQAFDVKSAPILGVIYSFDVDGTEQDGMGDIYRYQFESATPKMLTAHSASMQASAMIHAGTGFVDSSNNVGCNAADDRSAAS